MKKIFAIALALVMVLSMASAFAWKVECETRTYAWNCDATTTDCGKGKIEVVPFVKVNSTACDAAGWKYVESECAAAVNTTDVYFAIKMTIEANPDKDWWDAASVTYKSKGLFNKAYLDDVEKPYFNKTYAHDYAWANSFVTDDNKGEDIVVYLKNDRSAWIDAASETFKLEDVVFDATVVEAEKAELCATLKSADDGLGEYIWGDYYVYVAKNAQHGTKTYEYVIAFANNDDRDEVVYMCIKDGKVATIDADAADDKFYAAVNTDFNLNACSIGTCVGEDDIQANFGWKDEQKDCLTWSTEAASIVDAECVVAIPKTGDVSVVAYAVMAVVAAAGTMLKK